jgi:DNA modification methylase
LTIPPCLSLPAVVPRLDRPEGFQEDFHFPRSLVRVFLNEYTEPGDVVLDPFVGFGTTVAAAQPLGRHALGIDILPERVEYARARLPDERQTVILGDARFLSNLSLPWLDFSITSPPYMSRSDPPEDPLSGGVRRHGDYAGYLRDMRSIYAQLREVLKPGARAVINAANIITPDGVSPLAWDLAATIGQELRFEREVVINWDREMPHFTGDYCLIFVRP